MNLLNILPLEIAQSLKDSVCVGSVIVAIILAAWLISTLLHNYEIRRKLKKLKNWRKFSEIEKKQKHEEYDRIAAELKEERYFSDIQSDMHVRLMLKYASIQEDSEKTKNTITELKKSFTDAVDEIKKLVAENKLLESRNEENLKQIAYLKSVKNHKKRPIFEPEVKEWICMSDEYFPTFLPSKKYKDAFTTAAKFDKETTLCLLSEAGIACLVEKVYFTPVKN